MFIVHNLTNSTVHLPDLRIEVGARKIMDLEQAVSREAIERSQDIRAALRSKKLVLTRHTVIQTPAIQRAASAPVSDRGLEEKLLRVVKEAVAEEFKAQQKPQPPQPHHNIEESIQRAVASSMGGLVNSIRDQINNVQVKPETKPAHELSIDPERFAEISQKTVDRLAQEIETSGPKKPKKINIINKNATDLADEL